MTKSINTGDTIHINVNDSGLNYEINKGNESRRSMTPSEIHNFLDLIIIDKYYANPIPSQYCDNNLLTK